MLYVINGNIHFRDTDGALWVNDEHEQETVTLTATTSRLLSFLLEHHGNVASRDDILEMVWTNHGLRSSNNSLNKYIADLRRVFHNFELTEEFIITVPKVGFMISRSIDVQKIQIGNSDEQYHAQSIESISDAPIIKAQSNKNNITLYYIIYACITLLALTPIVLSRKFDHFSSWGINTIDQSPYYLLGSINDCDIYTLKQSSLEMIKTKIYIAENLIKASGLNCIKNTTFFYQPSDPVVYGYPGRVFLARCTFSKDVPHEFAACDNFYGANYIHE
ncbi:winged helix-turn-helix domain-containing protein [Enterobacter kobei]|nr:winged helix-turn-helix domain-containing protein [Enterobacter kobei]